VTRIPLTRDEANAYVVRWHRHHGRVVGHKFALGAVLDERVVGVAIVGRPVARRLDDGFTVEILRVATDGTPHVCSFLYGACRRAAYALGFTRCVTYILATEPGTSLRAAGFQLIGEAGGGSWSRTSRPRVDQHPTQAKLRFEAPPCRS
jgi:hypothetical protein